MEEDIIRHLDFELLYPYPLIFLERYQRIFGVDKFKRSQEA